MEKLAVGYIPEHFSTPIMLAMKHHFFAKHDVEVTLKPYPSGSGHLIQSLQDGTINFAVGLTEAFVKSIASGASEFKIVGTYVESPLQWAVSTGGKRTDLSGIADLEATKCGISRFGSGSDVMSKVLRAEHEFADPFEYVVKHDFKGLRDAVNSKECDFFMWEHFTSKKYYDNGEIKRLGDIYTPWPSWVLVTATSNKPAAIDGFVASVNEGIAYFLSHVDEGIEWIYTNLDYTEDDAKAWFQTVRFSTNVGEIDPEMIENTVVILQDAAGLPANSLDKVYTIAG